MATKKEVKDFVRIQSTKTIRVTGGLQASDVTNPDAHIADRLKINPTWPMTTVLIEEGVGIYPSKIVEWNSVQAVAKQKILTIGEFVDGKDDEVTEKVKDLKTELDKNIKAQEQRSSLNEIAGE